MNFFSEKEGVTWEPADKTPGSRINGLNVARTLLYNSVHYRNEEPGLYFTKSTSEVVRSLLALPLDEKNPEDVDTDSSDHLWDCLRYIVLHKSKEIQYTKVKGV